MREELEQVTVTSNGNRGEELELVTVTGNENMKEELGQVTGTSNWHWKKARPVPVTSYLLPVTCYKLLVPVLLAILMLVTPASVFAQRINPVPAGETTYEEAYVPCGTLDVQTRVETVDPTTKAVTATMSGNIGAPEPDGKVDNPCGFNDVITFARTAITGWIMAGATIAALGFAYAGFLYITAMGSQEKISHAHMIFVKTFWGFVFMLSAWLIAKTMENIFLSEELKQKSFLYTAPPPSSGGNPPAGGGNP